MRAIVTTEYGSGPALAEVQTPIAGPGEIRIKVDSTSVNGFDNAMAHGYLRGLMEHEFPAVLGRDFAGTVDQIGEGVTAFSLGDEVFGVVLTQPLQAGGFAEYLVIPESHNVALIPSGLDHATAGVLGLAGSAAMATFKAVAPRAGEVVLVSGATGGVGSVIMQMLADCGATVVATAQPGAETDHVKQFGATHVVDYAGDVPAQVRAISPDGVDVALHFAGDPMQLADLVANGGRFASLLGVGADQFAERDLTAHSIIANPERDVLEHLAGEVIAGRLRILVQRSYTLDEVPQAFVDFNSGTIGKLAIRID